MDQLFEIKRRIERLEFQERERELDALRKRVERLEGNRLKLEGNACRHG